MHPDQHRWPSVILFYFNIFLIVSIFLGIPVQAVRAGAGGNQGNAGLHKSAQARLAMAAPPTKYTFASFDPGTIMGGAPAYNHALDVSTLPGDDYLFFTLTADFLGGANPTWSSTLQMKINDGGTLVYIGASTANYGKQDSGAATTLGWTGVFLRPYTGGGSLTVTFEDPYTDASGPYTSSLSNVQLTIYPAPTPEHVFANFSPGTITGGAPAYTHALDVSTLPVDDYLFFTLTADFVGGANPTWSSTLLMEINDGGTVVYEGASTANYGKQDSGAATTLGWTGVFLRPYTGGGSLTVKFEDPYTDASGPYTSDLSKVQLTIYPAPTPEHVFANFSPGTITGGAPAYTHALDVSALPAYDHLFFTLTVDFVGGANPTWSSTLLMEINDGGSIVYKGASTANSGAQNSGAATTLGWTGVFLRPYNGGTSLTVKFEDPYTDASGPYTSNVSNVNLTIYLSQSAGLIRVANDCSLISQPCSTSLTQAIDDVAVGGTLSVVDTLAAEDVVVDKNIVLQSEKPGVLTGNGGAATVSVAGGEVIIQNLTINAGSSAHAIAVSGGDVTIRGNNIDGEGAAGIAQSGGLVTAYANNIVDTGGVGVSGTVAAPKNWWGTAVEAGQPSGVPAGDWAVRLGAAMVGAAFDSGGFARLGNARLTGPGPGTGVIIRFGRGEASTPFGVGLAPYSSQTCSEYYDFYSTGGAGWTVVLPVDTMTAGCSANVLNAKKAYMIGDVSECVNPSDTACWDAIPDGQIAINGNNLEISGLSLAGTHMVAGDSNAGRDPTAVKLTGFNAHNGRSRIAVLFGIILVAGGGLGWNWRRMRTRRARHYG